MPNNPTAPVQEDKARSTYERFLKPAADIPSTARSGEPVAFLDMIGSICAPPPASAYVYSGYIATMLIAKALRNDREAVIEPKTVRIDHTGDAKYAVTCADHNGTRYRITIEVVRP